MAVILVPIDEFVKYKERYKECMNCGAMNKKENELCFICEFNSFHPISESRTDGFLEAKNVVGDWEVTVG